jgi:hypothetical protein
MSIVIRAVVTAALVGAALSVISDHFSPRRDAMSAPQPVAGGVVAMNPCAVVCESMTWLRVPAMRRAANS